MGKRKASSKRSSSAAGFASTLLMGILIGAAVVTVVAAVYSGVTVKMGMTGGNMEPVALGALFAGALLGSVLMRRRWSGSALVWGLIVGAALAAVCLLLGLILGAQPTFPAAGIRLLIGVLGGVAGGVLSAVRKNRKR